MDSVLFGVWKVVVGSQSMFPSPYPFLDSRSLGFYVLQVILLVTVVGVLYYWVRMKRNDTKVAKLQEIEDEATQ